MNVLTMNAIETPMLNAGQRLAGCYTLKHCLSEQAENAVWLAQDEVLGKEITLHFIPSAILRDQRAVAELRQEVKRNRQLIHPNILRVYDYVEDGATAAVSMDKFDGRSLAEILKSKGALEPQEIQPWIAQLAETLSDAHRIQLIHRDLAPDNLIVRSNGNILISSFGIGRSMRDAMERAGIAKGETAHLSYMSPQQIDGDRPIPADDVYGLGALIFELLTGRPPFVGNELVPQIRKAQPPAINALRAEHGKAAVPDVWQNVVEACLAKTAEQRPKSCGEVASMIAGSRSAPASSPATAVAPARVEIRESAAPSRSAPSESPAKTPVESAPAKDSPATSSVKATLPPTPPATIAIALASAAKKSAPAVPANYPDLERPGSKRAAVLVALAAVALGAGVMIHNMSENGNDDTDKSFTDQPNGNSAAPANGSTAAPAPDSTGNNHPAASEQGASANPGTLANNAGSADANPGSPGNSSDAGQPPTPPDADKVVGNNEPSHVTKPPTPRPTKPTLIGEPVKENTKPPVNVAEETPKTPEKPAKTETLPEKAVVPAVVDNTPAAALPEIPVVPPKLVIPPNATTAQLEQLLAERQAAADKFSAAEKAVDTAGKEAAKQRDAKQVEIEQAGKAYDIRKKGLVQVITQGSDAEKEAARMEEKLKSAKAAAVEAVKAAENAEKALTEYNTQAAEKVKAKKKAEDDLAQLVLAGKNTAKPLDDLNNQVTKAESLRQQAATGLKQLEQDKSALAAQLAKARAAEAEALRKANREKIAGIEAQMKPLEAEATKMKSALAQLKDLGAAGEGAAKQIQQQLDEVNAKISAKEEEIKALNGGALPGTDSKRGKKGATPVPPKTGATATEQPATPTATVGNAGTTAAMAAARTPALPAASPLTPLPANPPAAPAPTVPPVPASNVITIPDPAPAPAAASETNSLGMKFADVGSVQFAIYPVTRQQFEVFAKSTNLNSNAWQDAFQPGPFHQGPDHPVVNVTWREADAFCKWLTERERKTGQLKSGEVYRLPTDQEWSKAVGLPEETGSTPEDRDMSVPNVYPWGSQWPPPAGAGNYCGEETRSENPIQGYNDSYEFTAPVGKFKPTAAGLYDMSGNVFQWVSDDWNKDHQQKTLRGSSWKSGDIQLSLLSSCRAYAKPTTPNEAYGFRVVKAPDSKSGKH